VPVWRKANLRDEPPSKGCVSAQSGFVWQPSLQNSLNLPPLWQRLFQWILVGGRKENEQQHFSSLANTKTEHFK
jgi:hypothetical protein